MARNPDAETDVYLATVRRLPGAIGRWSEWTDNELSDWRYRLYEDLLLIFPDIEGPSIKDQMDAALADADFPFDRLP